MSGSKSSGMPIFRYLILSLLLLSAACAVVPAPPVVAVDDLYLQMPDGSRRTVSSMITASPDADTRESPEGAIAREELGPALDWLAAHDANGDGYLTTGELNAGGVLLAVWALTDRPYSADALVDRNGSPVRTLSLAPEDGRRLVAVINSDPATNRILVESRLRLALAKDKRNANQRLFIGSWF
jgi:hypothetical protein